MNPGISQQGSGSLTGHNSYRTGLFLTGQIQRPYHPHQEDSGREGALRRMRRAGASLNQILRLTGTSAAMVGKAVRS